MLKPLNEEDLLEVLQQALTKDEWLKTKTIELKETEALITISGGDARKLLNLLELVTEAAPSNSPGGGEHHSQSQLKQETAINKDTPTGEVSERVTPPPGEPEGAGAFDFWTTYKKAYAKSLAEAEKNNMDAFDEVLFHHKETHYTLSAKANRAALFIMLYRGYPLLQLPFQLLNNLLEIDEQLSTWRHRHLNMVHRMIGTRIGTGGSGGKDYLKAAADKHYIFKEIAQLNSFLIERRRLPQLPKEVEEKLGYLTLALSNEVGEGTPTHKPED